MFKNVTVNLLIAILLLINLTPITSYGFTPEETIQENLVKYNQLNDEILELNTRIAALDTEIYNLNSNLEENQTQRSNIESEIANTEATIAQTQEDLDSSQGVLDYRVRNMYKSNLSSNIIYSILTATSLSDLISRAQAIYTIISADKKIIADINTKKDDLTKIAENLTWQNYELIAIQKSIESDLADIEEKRAVQQGLWDELNSEMNSVFSVIEENERQLISHSLSIATSSSSSAAQLQNAIDTLEALIPQLNSSSVINSAKDGIAKAKAKIAELNTPIPSTPGGTIEGAIATYSMESTAYYGHGITATGTVPVRNPNGISTIAVDPNVIPLGSKVHVSGYGVAIAADTGGAIKGNIIDVYLNSYQECMNWGRRQVTVQLLAYPGEW